ncbi:hypothetical protein ACFUYE_29015 [Micromonospora humida]|uniref:hypothetical protein n=1 Tax=Micromonospora humida TaxID=2809018 RepID=UPI00366ABBF9
MTTISPSRRAAGRFVAALLAGILTLFVAATPARAHNGLRSAAPSPDPPGPSAVAVAPGRGGGRATVVGVTGSVVVALLAAAAVLRRRRRQSSRP